MARADFFDPKEEEVIIGATVSVKGAAGEKASVQTDAYGDFWFEDLPDDTFELKIEQGSKTKVFSGLDTAKEDINLGDIPLT